MESNTTVTLLFEDLALKITCFKIYKIYLKLFDQELFINVKFKFLDILKTKCNSVQERVHVEDLIPEAKKKITSTKIQILPEKFF